MTAYDFDYVETEFSFLECIMLLLGARYYERHDPDAKTGDNRNDAGLVAFRRPSWFHGERHKLTPVPTTPRTSRDRVNPRAKS